MGGDGKGGVARRYTGKDADEQHAEECDELAREVEGAATVVDHQSPGDDNADEAEGELREGESEGVLRG